MRRRADFGIATGAFPDVRDSWPDAVGRALAEGWQTVELTAVREVLLDDLLAFLEREGDLLGRLARVSVHAPIVLESSVASVVERLGRLPARLDVVVHPDVYVGEPAVTRLGARVVVENMDVQKPAGQRVEDLAEAFTALPDAGLCLDVAHVWTVDPSLRLAHDLLGAFGDRLRQLHVSGIEPDGTHRPTTRADLDLYAPVLARCRHVPWILEAELVA